MPDTGLVLCTTTGTLDTSTVNWTNPGNVTADDGAVASASPGNGEASDYLYASGYGFDLPSGATVDGVELQIDATYSLLQVGVNCFLTLLGTDLDSGGRSGNNGSGVEIIGGPADLWDTTLSVAEVEASTFGVLISIGGGAPSGGTASIDAIWMRITYTEGTEPQSFYSYRRRSVTR